MPVTLGPMMEVARIQSEINRLFESLLDLGGDRAGGAGWMPTADIVETDEALVMHVEVPGVPPDKLSVSVHGGNVIIRGDKEVAEAPGGAKFHAAERQHGQFRRVIQLGIPVNTRQADASLHDGLLRIRFPKVPNRRGEEVPIEVKLS